MKKQFYTVAEAAQIIGVSTTAIYNKMNKELSKYVSKDLKGKKVILAEGLLPYLPHEDEGFEGFETVISKKPSKVVNLSNLLLEEKNKRISELEGEIERLRAAIEEKDKHMAETTNRLMDVLEQTAKLQENYQVLIARQQEVKQISDKKGFLRNIFHKANTPHQE